MGTPLFVAGDRVTVTPTSVVIKSGKGFSEIPLDRIVRVDFFPPSGQGMGAILFIPNDRATPPTIAAAVDAGLGVFFSPAEEAVFARARSIVEEKRGLAGAPMSPPTPWLYQMVQIPPHLVVQGKAQAGNEAAAYLQNLTNNQAAAGWEFYRVDSFTVTNRPGCLGSLFGGSGQTLQHYVVTFRKPRDVGATAVAAGT